MKPKKLSLREMWELYKILEPGLQQKQEYLIDEIFEMLDHISQEDFLQSLLLLYPRMEFAKFNPIELAAKFVNGLRYNEFFAFVDVVQGIKHGSAKR